MDEGQGDAEVEIVGDCEPLGERDRDAAPLTEAATDALRASLNERVPVSAGLRDGDDGGDEDAQEDGDAQRLGDSEVLGDGDVVREGEGDSVPLGDEDVVREVHAEGVELAQRDGDSEALGDRESDGLPDDV